MKNNALEIWRLNGGTPWNKGKKIRLNTGRTHFKTGSVPWNKGTEGVMKAWNKGIKMDEEYCDRVSERNKARGVVPPSRKGLKHTKEVKKKISVASLDHWTNKKYRKSVLGRRKMSGLEIKVQKVIDKHSLPYKFVGNGKFFIERKNPDFINVNGEKIAVEVYWKKHKDQFRGSASTWIKNRQELFKKYGWRIIFIEGSGLTDDKIKKYLICERGVI